MIAATLFSGIGAPECAGPETWVWAWHAEIEKFPSAVMRYRHPESANLGDVNAEDFCERAERRGRPDVIVFGSPCQDFSIAGQRVGLDGARGNLALVALRIVKRLRPRWFCFENVPGLFSSYSGSAEAQRALEDRIRAGGGRAGGEAVCVEDSDFAAFLAAIRECGYLGCYRVLDAQFAGVPQRRRRIFFVGYLGDWRPPVAVLFEPESLRGDHPPSRETGERVAPTIEARANAGGAGWGIDFMTGGGLAAEIPEVANPLTARMHKGVNTTGDEGQTMIPVAFDCKAGAETGFVIGDIASALRGEGHGGGHAAVLAFSCKDYGNDATIDVSPPLRAMNEVAGNQNAGGQVAIAFEPRERGDDGRGYDRAPNIMEECSPALNTVKTPAVAFQTRVARNGRGAVSDVVPALNGADAGATSDMRPCVAVFKPSHYTRAKDGAPSDIASPLTVETDKGDQDQVLFAGAAVRRLTPVECEKLQGFEPGYTDVPYRGKPAADGPRYKSLGNAMNVAELRWILGRIDRFEKEVLA